VSGLRQRPDYDDDSQDHSRRLNEGGCGCLWFDRCELMRVDESDGSAGEGLLEVGRDADLKEDLSSA
jgi:hypothetical protein